MSYATSLNHSDPVIRELLNQEDAFWGSVPYDQFEQLWNDNVGRPPLSRNSNHTAEGGLALAAGVSIANPLPGPEDLAALGIAVLVIGAVGIVNALSVVSLPARPAYTFSRAINHCIQCTDELSRNAQCDADSRGVIAIQGGCQGKHHRSFCK